MSILPALAVAIMRPRLAMVEIRLESAWIAQKALSGIMQVGWVGDFRTFRLFGEQYFDDMFKYYSDPKLCVLSRSA